MGYRGSRGSGKVENFMEKGLLPIMETGKSLKNQKRSTDGSEKSGHIGNRPTYYIPSRNRVEKLVDFPTHPRPTDNHIPLDRPRRNKTKSRKKPISTHRKLISSSISSVLTCQEQSSSGVRSERGNDTAPHQLGRVFNDQIISTDQILPIPLPPIVTKPIKKYANTPNFAIGNQSSKQGRLSSHGYMRGPSTPQTPRIKVRLNSPKLAKKKLREKKGLAESFAVVKLSSDPQSDFRESMLEMIFQNNLWASKDLEDLLSCYLYLNSDEYHDLIVKIFKQIWSDLTVMSLQYK